MDIHQETAIAIDIDTGFEWVGSLCPHGSGKAESHGSQATRGDPGSRFVEAEVLGGKHLVLAHTGTDNGFVEKPAVAKEFVKTLDGMLRQYGIFAVSIAHGFCLAPSINLAHPWA